MNTKTEESTNMETNTEVIGGSVVQQAARDREGGASVARTEEMEKKKEPKTSEDKNRSKAKLNTETEETTNMEADTETIGEAGLKQWEDWGEDDLEEKNTINDEELINQRSIQSFQRRENELSNNVAIESIGAMEEHNSTNQKEGERDNCGSDKEEMKEDEGKTTETSVASDEESREETEVDLQTQREEVYIDIETLQSQIDNCHDDHLEDLEKQMKTIKK